MGKGIEDPEVGASIGHSHDTLRLERARALLLGQSELLYHEVA